MQCSEKLDHFNKSLNHYFLNRKKRSFLRIIFKYTNQDPKSQICDLILKVEAEEAWGQKKDVIEEETTELRFIWGICRIYFK